MGVFLHMLCVELLLSLAKLKHLLKQLILKLQRQECLLHNHEGKCRFQHQQARQDLTHSHNPSAGRGHGKDRKITEPC